jgi:hypothetical protein
MISKKFYLKILGVVVLIGVCNPAECADVSARATSKNGGTAVSRAAGEGDCGIEAVSEADGGYAEALVEGIGIDGGRTDASGYALSHDGVARTRVRSKATYGAYVDAFGSSLAHVGRAMTDVQADGIGSADLAVEGIAESQRGEATSLLRAWAWGRRGGQATLRGFSHAIDLGGRTQSDVTLWADADYGGDATAESDAVAIGRQGRTARARSQVGSRAVHHGRSFARGESYDVTP